MNAQKFEDAFYASANPDLCAVRPSGQPKEPEKPREPERPASASLNLLNLLGLLEQLQKSPELVNMLTTLLSVVPSGKKGGKVRLATPSNLISNAAKKFGDS